MTMPKLFTGDNLEIMQAMVSGSFDLVYLDPPFCSGRNYGEEGGPIDFVDTWKWSLEDERWMDVHVRRYAGTEAGKLVKGIVPERTPLGAYLVFMAPRLLEIARLLRPEGTMVLHCDPTASHYLKIACDRLFGITGFLNEVVWRYRRWPTPAKRYQRMHDTLLVYARPQEERRRFFDPLVGVEEISEKTRAKWGDRKQEKGAAKGLSTDGTMTEGNPLSDVWDVSLIAPTAHERNGYPTQKPLLLMERIVMAHTHKGMSILDPFCGSGSMLEAAIRLGRTCVGIDRNPRAIGLAVDRFV